jgi:ketosteroid isomerase-like protein
MSQTNVDLVRLAYDVAYDQRSLEGLDDRFSADFIWYQRPEWPGRFAYGRDEIPQLWADLDETYSEFLLVPVEFADAGEYVVVTVNTSARLRASDVRLEATIWHVWRMVDGVAVEARAYSDQQEAREAAGLDGSGH